MGHLYLGNAIGRMVQNAGNSDSLHAMAFTASNLGTHHQPVPEALKLEA